MDIFNLFQISGVQWVFVIIAAFLVGFSKTGISGFTMLVIPILANVFGGKNSTGILLPMLIAGDVFAVWHYNRHAEWNNIKKLVPWAFGGLILGSAIGNCINDRQFKMLIALSVIICLSLLTYMEMKGEYFNVPGKAWFYVLAGIASGFTSMIGNAAGPIMSIYLLAMGFKKNYYMGTFAWFFLIINLMKVPFQIFVWHNITLETVMLTCAMIPAITIGAFLGTVVVRRLNEKPFRYIILAMTGIAAFRLLI